MWDTMMTSTTTSYENNWHNIPVKSEPETHETDSPTSQFDTKNMFFESNTSSNTYHPLGFNPLTPPGYPNILLPSHQRHVQTDRPTTPLSTYPSTLVSQHTSLTPTHTPPIDVTPPKSPKEINETPEKAETDHLDSECGDSYDDNHSISSDLDEVSIKVPKVNSHGKIKTHKCKQCGFVAVTKISFWEHTKAHIKPEKMLSCPKCPFVTEYKHHLEYHLRNHQRSKPFQCPSCSYSCVNKSMLNSHLKSHSSIFQYRCADCNYATKYCHSLKLHLRKYSHKPDIVLNQDGTPNPLPIIDVYGTRRGPKTKANQTKADLEVLNTAKRMKIEKNHKPTQMNTQKIQKNQQKNNIESSNVMTSMLPSALANMFQNQNPSMPLFPYLNLNLQMFAAQQQALSQLSPSFSHSPPINNNNLGQDTQDALNLSQNKTPLKDTQNNFFENPYNESFKQMSEHHMTPSGKNRRKGRAYKLTTAPSNQDIERPSSVSSTENSIQFEREFTPANTPTRTDTPESTTSVQLINNNKNIDNKTTITAAAASTTTTTLATVTLKEPKKLFECKFCDISFKDDVLYTIHMGYHGYNDVFKCNMCGEKCDDRVSFFLHIARSSHT